MGRGARAVRYPGSVEVSLRPLAPYDFEAFRRWSTDREFCLANGWSPDLDEAALRAWWDGLLGSLGPAFDRQGVVLEGQLVGYVDLADIDDSVGRASLGVAIGERSMWGRGLGRAACVRMLERGFEHLGLTRVIAEVHAPNTRSLALVAGLGFTQEGRLRRHDMYRGGVCDVLVFGLLREEFEGH